MMPLNHVNACLESCSLEIQQFQEWSIKWHVCSVADLSNPVVKSTICIEFIMMFENSMLQIKAKLQMILGFNEIPGPSFVQMYKEYIFKKHAVNISLLKYI